MLLLPGPGVRDCAAGQPARRQQLRSGRGLCCVPWHEQVGAVMADPIPEFRVITGKCWCSLCKSAPKETRPTRSYVSTSFPLTLKQQAILTTRILQRGVK